MASTSDIRNGLCFKFNNDLVSVVEFLHVKPGKGNAFVRTKLKSLTDGRVLETTFQSGHKIDVVRIERRKFQYLYPEDSRLNFMDNETFEQIILPKEMIENADLLKEGMEVEIVFHSEEDRPLTAELLPKVTLEVTYTERGLKGDTASSNSLKPATLETGAEVKVPLFVNTGDKIVVNTVDRSYVERAK